MKRGIRALAEFFIETVRARSKYGSNTGTSHQGGKAVVYTADGRGGDQVIDARQLEEQLEKSISQLEDLKTMKA